MNKVIVGLSGGVDSSVSAYLLKQQGFDVEAVFMKNWDEDDDTEYCTSKQDLQDAQSVANALDIPLHCINFAAEYWDKVFSIFLEQYKAGHTPNPDVLCNKEIKFNLFFKYALSLNAEYIATGHYARFQNGCLYRGIDGGKDQSYFLHAVNKQALEKSIFPLGDLKKTQVRTIAQQQGFITHNKKDSTGICFIGERKFSDFLAQYLPAQPGDIVDEHGNTIGQHQGLMFYTMGQRQGIKIGGTQSGNNEPWYVVEKDILQNQLIVVQGENHPRLMHHQVFCGKMHWLVPTPNNSFSCMAQLRYRQQAQQCNAKITAEGIQLEFCQSQRSVTPGQYAVLYDADRCLGGAIIQDRA